MRTLRARRGDVEVAERLAGESVAFADRTDFLLLRSYAHSSLAEVLSLVGRADDATASAHEARRLAEQKGLLVLARKGEQDPGRYLGQAEAPGTQR